MERNQKTRNVHVQLFPCRYLLQVYLLYSVIAAWYFGTSHACCYGEPKKILSSVNMGHFECVRILVVLTQQMSQNVPVKKESTEIKINDSTSRPKHSFLSVH